jgi:cell division GTPase FtsZ
MKLLVIGLGDGGCRLAGCFSELNKKARSERRLQIINGAYGVNNDRDELLSQAKSEFREMQTIFVNHKFSDVDTSALAGAEMMRLEGNRVLTAIKPNDFYDTDAIVFVTGTAGKFGSGGAPVLMQQLRDRHIGKPLFAIALLPFDSESGQQPVIYNTALCLKSLQKAADAVFIVDNEKFRLAGHLASPDDKKALIEINNEIVLPFYDLLCATETMDPKMAGARNIGIGDLLQTLSGWTTLGIGRTEFPTTRSLFKTLPNFQEKGSETQKAMEAMNLALGRMSVDVKLEDTGRALYLLSIPSQGANLDMVKVLGNHLREITNNAIIRGGDFYGARDHALVTLILSDLNYVESIKNYFDKAVGKLESAALDEYNASAGKTARTRGKKNV